MGSDFTPRDVYELITTTDVQLIDVRRPDEHQAGRIAGARHVELALLAAEADTIARDRQIIFYCRSGSRSAMATEAFSSAGYDAHNMTGGMIEWQALGLPIVPDGGYVAD